MSYIETNNIAGKRYKYFVKKINIAGRKIRVKKLMGKEGSVLTKEEFLKNNIKKIAAMEVEKRLPLLKPIEKKFYNTTIPEENEKNTVLLSNIIEAGKNEDEFYNIFAKDFIFNSNNIEGSKIPKEKVAEIMEKGDTRYADRNEVKEVKNSITAFNYLREGFKFNQKSILRLYSLLTGSLKREDGSVYTRGFKKTDIVVGNSKTTKPGEVKKELKKLLSWYKKNRKTTHPIELAFEFHLRYESIHPFIDANGRTGRMIMNKILMQNYYSPIIIYKENKLSYFNAIEKAREGKTQKYFQFMIGQANKTYKEMLQKIRR